MDLCVSVSGVGLGVCVDGGRTGAGGGVGIVDVDHNGDTSSSAAIVAGVHGQATPSAATDHASAIAVGLHGKTAPTTAAPLVVAPARDGVILQIVPGPGRRRADLSLFVKCRRRRHGPTVLPPSSIASAMVVVVDLLTPEALSEVNKPEVNIITAVVKDIHGSEEEDGGDEDDDED